mmetsp:Transcript_52493/g.128283  ORF Transcript_52493/g.128283 Transcript_52493/m.128283 type:complete len:311 (-) Transcript_52493:1017-1949(-)
MMTRRMSCVKGRASPLRVMTSNFSGVITMICVSASCSLLSWTSPVNSRTVMPYSSRRFPKLSTISATSAFMGARYTILKPCRSIVPSSWRCRPISCSMVSSATLVLPAPVGAHTSMFSLPNSAVWQTLVWMRFSDSVLAKAGRAHSGSSEILVSVSSVSMLRVPGTYTSSYPLCDTRCDPSGSSHRLFAIRCPPCAKASDSRSRMARGCVLLGSTSIAVVPASWSIGSAPSLSLSPRSSLRRRFSISRLRSPSVLWEKVRASRMLWPCGVLRISAWIEFFSASSCACRSRVQKSMACLFLRRTLMNSNLS